MNLGAFSISLSVEDLTRSRTFYETLGFEVTGGDPEQGWLILVNGPAVIGLFQGMFEGSILTFNPGWNGPHEEAESFEDGSRAFVRLAVLRAVQRQIAQRLEAAGLAGALVLVDDLSYPTPVRLRQIKLGLTMAP